ncbi:MAG: hypothetical protein IPM18_01755 [Phycisphaerales bacterium]|nr:hypothetical protein [Phycisphaerales bacterium]
MTLEQITSDPTIRRAAALTTEDDWKTMDLRQLCELLNSYAWERSVWAVAASIQRLLMRQGDATVLNYLHPHLLVSVQSWLTNEHAVPAAIESTLARGILKLNDQLAEVFGVASRGLVGASLLLSRDAELLRATRYATASCEFGLGALLEACRAAEQAPPVESLYGEEMLRASGIPASLDRRLDPVAAVFCIAEYMPYLRHIEWYDLRPVGQYSALWHFDLGLVCKRLTEVERAAVLKALPLVGELAD